MIICSLEIDNYKQYAGHHLIDFPEQGIVSVTGPNGAGKTTLFEAIEWALYNPRSIPKNTIPPHEGVGKTVVRVTLEDPAESVRYCVERTLRLGATQAEIYREDTPGEPIVQGTGDVTRYVTRHLIGLPHDAFVSTFFTRQKELHFFGDRSDTRRRTEVARLLGLEAVREAQTLIGEERTAARNEAAKLRAEYDSKLGARDLAVEEATATGLAASARSHETAAEAASLDAEQAALAAREEFERWRDLQLQAVGLERRVAEVSGHMRELAANRDAARNHLVGLEARAAERVQHAAISACLAEFQAAARAHEAERDRAQQAANLRQRRETAESRLASVVSQLAALVREHAAATPDPRWDWSAPDLGDPVTAVARLQAVAGEADPHSSRAHVAALQEVNRLGELLGQQQETLDKYQHLLHQLRESRSQLVADGGPDAAARAAQEAVTAARGEERAAREAVAAAQVARKEAERVIAELKAHAGDAACPVCSRELSPGDAERLIAERQRDVAQLRQREQAGARRVTAAVQAIAAGEAAQQAAQARREELATLDVRLQNGEERTEQAQASVWETREGKDAAERAARATYPVGAEMLDAARTAAERQEQLAAQAGLLAQFGRDLREAREALRRATDEAAALGEVRYDAAAHQQANADLTAAQRAATLVERIDDELTHRPAYERRRDEAEVGLRALAEQRDELQREQVALGFDLARLQAAQAHEHAARAAAMQASEARSEARRALIEAEAAQKRVRDDHAKLAELLDLADRKARESDDLHRMYTEFGEFDQYVARQVGPMLAETTERLLAQVTNSKYSQIRFDENYGIHVYDGDESFPLSSFSGGERDVVALCARLALSEIVGSAAARPPRFLVLDEVFASLDSDRREQLLETLGVVANGGQIRQMFIISHVEDVQQSPVMNEAWIISERDGSSYVDRPSFFGAPLPGD